VYFMWITIVEPEISSYDCPVLTVEERYNDMCCSSLWRWIHIIALCFI